jgi:hypothetical protein
MGALKASARFGAKSSSVESALDRPPHFPDFVDGEVAMGGVAPTLDDVRTGDVSMITSGG